MQIINIYNAKTNLSKLIAQVELGKEIVISRADKPVAVLKPYQQVKIFRKAGSMKGKIKMAPDFDVLPKSFMKYFTK